MDIAYLHTKIALLASYIKADRGGMSRMPKDA
jgi:hypothetical protein